MEKRELKRLIIIPRIIKVAIDLNKAHLLRFSAKVISREAALQIKDPLITTSQPTLPNTTCSTGRTCRTYFGVESQEQGGCESSTAGSSSLNIASVVEKTMQLALHSGATLPTDSVREANLFYITMDWAKKPGEEQDRLSTVLKHTLLHIPGEGEEHYVMAQQIHEIFLNSLKNVSSFGFQLRININVDIKGSRGPKTFTPP
ncbi:hypothetical protein EMCRGX_G032170 [Ephydatia muelleri]